MLGGAVWAQCLGHEGILFAGLLSDKDVMDSSNLGGKAASKCGIHQIVLTCTAATVSDEETASRRRDRPSVKCRTTKLCAERGFKRVL